MRLLVVILFLFLASACKDRDTVNPITLTDRQIVLNSLGSSVITLGFVELQTEFNALRGHVKEYSEDSTSAFKLLALRDQWLNTATQLKRMSIFSFGPVDQNYFRANISSPINTRGIEEILNKNAPIDSAVIRGLPTDRKGLGAVEYLIFGNDPLNYPEVIKTFTQQTQKTAYLRALCDEMQRQVNFVLLKWSRGGEGYVDTFIANDGDDTNSSISVLYGMISYQASLAKKRVEDALTLKVNDGFRPDLIEAPYSSKSLELLKAEVSCIQVIFTGMPISSSNAKGFNWLLDKTGAKKGDELLSQVIMRQFSTIYTKIDAITPSLAVVVLSNPAVVKDLLNEIDNLKSLIDNEVKTNLYIRE